jgi:hypothetical protein
MVLQLQKRKVNILFMAMNELETDIYKIVVQYVSINHFNFVDNQHNS